MTCTHGMPSAASCVDCMDEGLLAPPPKLMATRMGPPITARFPGHCRGCNLPIHEGQSIVPMGDVDGFWLHESCAK